MTKIDSDTGKLQKTPPRKAIRSTGSGLRVVKNASVQTVEDIPNEVLVATSAAVQRARKTSANAAGQDAEDIRSPQPAGNAPQLANGFKIVRNRAHQRVQKIKRAKLTAPVDDEIGYKKLFTRFEEAFVAKDVAGIGECLSPAFQWRLPNGTVIYGKKEAMAEMELRFAMPYGPKFHGSVLRFKGCTVIQTYDVDYFGPDGRLRQSRGMDLYEIGDGLITLKDAYWKMIP